MIIVISVSTKVYRKHIIFFCIIFVFRWDSSGAVPLPSYVEEWIDAGARWIGKFLF